MKNKYTYEILMALDHINRESWQGIIESISQYLGVFRKFSIVVDIYLNEIRYYIKSKYEFPVKIHDNSLFLLKEGVFSSVPTSFRGFIFGKDKENLIDIYNKKKMKQKLLLRQIQIDFLILPNNKKLKNIKFAFINKENRGIRKKMLIGIPYHIFSIDFSKNSSFFYKKVPNYLDISKSLHLLKSDNMNSILKIDTFPYLKEEYYLNQSNYNFDKHSLVVGASGTGKSKLISLFIANIASNSSHRDKYKVIVIDPHASLENDVGGLENTIVVDFKSKQNSVDLFEADQEELISNLENILSLLKNLMADMYNSKLERVLRFSIYLLILTGEFHFDNLRKILLDIDYRNHLIKKNLDSIPENVLEFFGNDFNELKTKHYSEAISPIISFIDEVNLLPAFYNKNTLNLKQVIDNHFLTIFSLDQSKLGTKVTKTIAGFVMNILLQLAQGYTYDEHIILIVDEVAIIESPILNRLLSEARKYNVSLMLGQQYFNQISPALKEAIFANVINYYVFRVSKDDATILEGSLNMKLNNNILEKRIKLLSTLNDRECVIRLTSNGVLQAPIKAKTIDFIPSPRVERKEEVSSDIEPEKRNNIFHFNLESKIALRDIMKNNSTSREGEMYHEL